MNLKIVILVFLAASFTLNAQIVRRGRQGNHRYFMGDRQVFGTEINGSVKAYWDSITVMGNYNYRNGVMHGLQKEYFNDGSLSAEWEMTEGRRTGKGTEYYDDGTVLFRRDLDDRGNGIGTEYYRNGMKMRERLYKDGVQVHVSFYNHDIKGNRYERTDEELFFEAQEFGSKGMYGHAIQSYGELLKKYPDSVRSANARFLIAFTYHNNLNEPDQAEKYYRIFIEKHPEDPLVSSAKFELENIGKDMQSMNIFEGEE